MKVTLILGDQSCFHETYLRSCDPRINPARAPVQQTLSQMYQDGRIAFCGCRKIKQPLQVVTRHNRHYLIPVEGTSHLHNQACPFYLAPKGENGRSQYADDVISEAMGVLVVKLVYPLAGEAPKAEQETDASDENFEDLFDLRASLIRLKQDQVEKESAPPVSTGHQALSTEALLHLLWERSKNNGWLSANPSSATSPRKWDRSAAFIRQICDRIVIEEWPLSEILLIIDSQCNKSAWDKIIVPLRNWANMSGTHRSNRFVLGLPNFFRRMPKGDYEMVFLGSDKTILIPQDVFNDFRLNNPRNFIGNTIRLRKRCIALLAVTSDQDGNLIAKSIGTLLADQQTGLPCRSDAAMKLATRLRGEYRHFEVPMDYGTDMQLPDFILLDGQDAERIPLYVLADDDFENRKPPPGAWVWDERKQITPPVLPVMMQSKADKIAASLKAATKE